MNNLEEKDKRKITIDETIDQYYSGEMSSVASSTGYTGLTPTPPITEEEAMAYAMLYVYPHESKAELDAENKSDKKKA